MSRASSWATIPRVSFLDSLQLIFHLVDACHDALLVEAGRTGEPDAPDHVVSDLDRHAAVDGDHVRQRRLLAPYGPRRHLLDEIRRGHLEGHRGVCLAAGILHGVRAGVIAAQRDHGVAAAIDHDHGGGVAARLAIIQRRLRDRQRDGIAQVLALNELRARWQCDGTGERDKCEAGCNDGRSYVFERAIALSVTAPWEFYSRPAPRCSAGRFSCSVRERIGPQLNVHGTRLAALAALHQPRRAIAVSAPQPAALPASIGIVDAPVEAFGVEADRIGNAQHHHLPILECDKAVVEVGGGDRNVLAETQRVVLVDPGVITGLGAGLLALEARAGIAVEGKALGTVIAGRIGSVERAFALAAIEADQAAVRGRTPHDAVLVDITAADAISRVRN